MSWSYKNSKHELSLNIKAAKHRNKLSQTLKGTFKNDETLMLPWQTTNKPDKARKIQNYKIIAKRRIGVMLHIIFQVRLWSISSLMSTQSDTAKISIAIRYRLDKDFALNCSISRDRSYMEIYTAHFYLSNYAFLRLLPRFLNIPGTFTQHVKYMFSLTRSVKVNDV